MSCGQKVDTGEPGSGWFADIGNGAGGELFPWQPFLRLGDGSCFPIPVWFESEPACLRFIKEEVTPHAGHLLPAAQLLA